MLALIEGARRTRFLNEIKALIPQRHAVFTQVHASYLETLKPSVRATRPPDVCRNIRPIADVIVSPASEQVNAASFSHVLERMDEVYAVDEAARIRFFKDQLPWGWVGRNERGVAALELATAVFYCLQHPFASLIGWSMAQMCRSELSFQPLEMVFHRSGQRFDRYGSALAGHLVRLVGLNPATATAEEMDRLDRRFFNPAWSTEFGYGVYTWRSAVSVCYPCD